MAQDLTADVIRTVILIVGVTLAMACVKFAYLALKAGEGYRAWGLASYGLLVLTPSITVMYRYDEELLLLPALTYLGGLACGVMALRKSYTVNPEWLRLRREHKEKQAARGH